MQVKRARTFIGKFDYQKDLLESVTDFCKKENIKFGYFNLIGAVTSATLGYYKQDQKQYINCLELDKKLEISSCMGNISVMDNDVFVHAHTVFSDHEGKCYGGHLMKGTKIFACEYIIEEFDGQPLTRGNDSQTGLRLWDI